MFRLFQPELPEVIRAGMLAMVKAASVRLCPKPRSQAVPSGLMITPQDLLMGRIVRWL